jgi:hypothetical protein
MTAFAGDYCTADDLKAHLRISDTNDDAALGVAITAASRAIDHECNRQFGLTGSAVARLYTFRRVFIEGRAALALDDLQTSVGLAVALDLDYDGVFEQSLTLGVDYDMYPWNAAADSKPWTHMVMRWTSRAYFPCFARGIQATGDWGWTAVPTAVQQACLIQAARFFVRRDSAYGVAGSPDLGSEIRLLARLDPDVALLLTSVKRQWGAV